jgi:hypothetical protein
MSEEDVGRAFERFAEAFQQQMAELRREMRAGFAEMRAEMRNGFDRLEACLGNSGDEG